MAPPATGLDSWISGRHFGIVIDAGSSGSRLQIYSWKDPSSISAIKGSELEFSLPHVEKGTEKGEDWVAKIEPGISSFEKDPEAVSKYLQPLLSHARKHIPPSLEKETPLFLLATAGMRLLTPVKQAEILHEACQFLIKHTNFKIDEPSPVGPCGSSVRIITGEEEGLFGWIAVNYLMDGFTGPGINRTTYGFLDMGGASTQIAFEPRNVSESEAKNLMDVRLRLLGGKEIIHKVFVTTWLGYGTNQARERYVGKAINEFETTRTEGQRDIVPDPCLPKDLELYETPVHESPSDSHSSKAHQLLGTGSFEQCMQKTEPLLNKSVSCLDKPCLMNGIHVPAIDFSVLHFIGVSEYWYSSEHIFGLGGAYDFVQYERAASKFCSQSWNEIMKQHELSKAQHKLGGDGELMKNGEVVAVGKWHASVERSRLEMQCFKAAWITNVLHEGIGIPRITDLGGNLSTQADKVVEEAGKKGLGRPAFQSLDTVGDIAISWTLGKMVLEASKEITPSSGSHRPLVDPIDDIPNSPDFPIKPIQPAFWTLDGLEDRLNPMLPERLTRTSLGFSPVFFLLLLASCFFVVLSYPLRRQLRTFCLRSVQNVARRDDSHALEEGTFRKSNASRPGSPAFSTRKWLHPIRRVFSFSGAKPQTTFSMTGVHKHPNNRPALAMTRSFSHNEIESTSSSYAPRGSLSRSPSPSPTHLDNGFMSNGPFTLARSRNNSQMNLSGSISRQKSSRNGTL